MGLHPVWLGFIFITNICHMREASTGLSDKTWLFSNRGLIWASVAGWKYHVGKTMPCFPPMTGNGLYIPPTVLKW